MALGLPILKARRAKVSLVINGEDIMLGLASQNLISFCYTDSTSDKADDLTISIADPDRTWMLRYLPKAKKGVECEAGIYISDWAAPSDTRPFECGIFFINCVDFKGPPNAVSIKASSIPPNGIKGEKKYKSWENKDLKGISGEIAEKNGLTLFYDTKDNPTVKRTDQKDKSDLEYLRDRCKESKLSLKIHKKQLVVYSEEEYEAREPAFELHYGNNNILDWTFSSKLEDTFKEAENSYVDPETGKITKTKFTDPDGSGWRDSKLILNEGVEYEPDDPDPDDSDSIYLAEQLLTNDAWNNSPSANKGKGKGGNKNSERKCKAKLREKNKKGNTSSIKVTGNIDYLSGLNVQTVGWGIFDRKWFIESSVHTVGSGGYTTDLKIRGALKGY